MPWIWFFELFELQFPEAEAEQEATLLLISTEERWKFCLGTVMQHTEPIFHSPKPPKRSITTRISEKNLRASCPEKVPNKFPERQEIRDLEAGGPGCEVGAPM